MNMRSNDGNFEKYKSEMLRMYQQQNRPINPSNSQKNNFSGASNQGEYAKNSQSQNDNASTNLNAQLSNMAGFSDPNPQDSSDLLRLDDDFPPASYRQDISSHTVRGDTPIEYDSQGRRTSDLIFEIADQNGGNVNSVQPQSVDDLSKLTENNAYSMPNFGQSQQNNSGMGNASYDANQNFDWQQFSNDPVQENRDSPQNTANVENIQPNNDDTFSSNNQQFQQDWQNFESRNKSNGFLKVQVYSARGAFPIKDAKITIFKEFDGQNKIFYEIVTDESGITQPVSLPAPDAIHSFAVDGIRPYENYSISISKFGFEDAVRSGLPIFPGVVSLQPIQLRPLLASQQDAEPNLEQNS